MDFDNKSLKSFKSFFSCFWEGTNKNLHRPGIEPGPPAWQASILPLNQRCSSSLMLCSSTAVVAEWLRRLTRNQFPSGSVGSNPTNCDMAFWIMSVSHCFPILDCFPLLLGTDSSIV